MHIIGFLMQRLSYTGGGGGRVLKLRIINLSTPVISLLTVQRWYCCELSYVFCILDVFSDLYDQKPHSSKMAMFRLPTIK